jgi:hypothetical protein
MRPAFCAAVEKQNNISKQMTALKSEALAANKLLFMGGELRL